ncbi:MAG: hypothetical protein ABIL22_09680 [candidate division WOR-3 bacterium]
MKILLLINFSVCVGINSYGIAQIDTNFKSIHQLQAEENKKDTTGNTLKNETLPKNPQGIFNQKQPVQTIINFSLMVVIILVLVIAISIFLIARRIYLTKK